MKINKLLIMALSLLVTVACHKTENQDSPKEDKVYLELEKTSLDIPSEGGEYIIPVKTNAQQIEILSNATWLKCSVSDAKDKLIFSAGKAGLAKNTAVVAVTASIGSSYTSATIVANQEKSKLSAYYVDNSLLDFSKSGVMDVMAGELLIARVCREYVYTVSKDVDARMDVIYPIGGNGEIDLKNGMDIHSGGTLSWERTETTDECKYTAPSPSKTIPGIYITDKGFSIEKPQSGVVETAVLVESCLVDNRADDMHTYPYVKVGTQYWLADNFKAEKYRDLSEIDSKGWGESGSFKFYLDDPEFKDFMGLAYNGYAVFNPKGLVPEGWEVPSVAQWDRLYNYLRDNRGTKLKYETWISAGEEEKYANITGLNIDCAYNWMPHGTTTGWNDESEKTYFWTSELVMKDNVKSYRYVYFMKSSSAMGRSYTESLNLSHEMDYGDYVRIVKPIK